VIVFEHVLKKSALKILTMAGCAGGTASFVVPRTQLPVCPSTNLAKHPEQFARVLTEKLEAVLRKREGNEKVQRAFKKIQEVSICLYIQL
jgi:hypothetical protein